MFERGGGVSDRGAHGWGRGPVVTAVRKQTTQAWSWHFDLIAARSYNKYSITAILF
jgi:hypothetical protein